MPGYATNPATFAVTVFSGEFSADGATPTGNMTGTEDIGAPTGASRAKLSKPPTR